MASLDSTHADDAFYKLAALGWRQGEALLVGAPPAAASARFLAALVIGSVELVVWWVPLMLWLVGFSIVRHRAPLKETPAQRSAREAAERKQAEQDEKRAAARKVVAERKRVDSFTKVKRKLRPPAPKTKDRGSGRTTRTSLACGRAPYLCAGWRQSPPRAEP